MICDWPMRPNNSSPATSKPRLLPRLLAVGLSLIAAAAQARPAPSPWAAMGVRLQTLNREILADRQRVDAIARQYLSSDDISEDDFNWLKLNAEKYGLEPRQRGDRNFFNALLSRMDVVPPSLALAQGWLEYGWRKPKPTRFPPACAPRCMAGNRTLAPEDMHAWVLTINTEPAGANFRTVRAQLRQQKRPLSGRTLAPALEPLTSEHGRYTARLTTVIRQFKMDRWDP